MVFDATRRLLYLRVAIVVGAMVGMILSHRLWVSARFYPLTPVFPFLKAVPSPFDYVLFGATLAVLAASAFTPRLIPIFATLAVVLAVCDQSRLQPWFYEYFFLLLGVSFAAPNACRLIVATTYIWSGIQKMNAGFVQDVFPWLVEPFVRHLPHGAQGMVHPMAVVAPFIELWIGIALLGRKFRAAGVVAAVAMHVFLLIALGPWGQNYNRVVWPWNIAMAAFVIILFWKESGSAKRVVWGEGPFHIGVLLLFGVAPAFSLFGGWDHYLSAAMYSNNRNRGAIFLSDKMFDRLPDGIGDYVRVETPELDSIDIAEWSDGELDVPPYPEVRIYKNVARKICSYATGPTDVRLSISSKSTIGKSITSTSYTCAALKDK
ncbi:MAG: MauE/DoxX family redox-associated membrane protein [Bryobacteraceae bacterium]